MHLFDQCFRPFFRYSTAKTRKYVEQQNISKIPITEKSIEKLILVHFLLLFLFRQMVKNYASCWATLPMFKVEIQHTNYFLYSNLKSQIFNMILL